MITVAGTHGNKVWWYKVGTDSHKTKKKTRLSQVQKHIRINQIEKPEHADTETNF